MKQFLIRYLLALTFCFSLVHFCAGQYVGLTVEGPSTNAAQDSTSLLINSQRTITGELGNIIIDECLFVDGYSIDTKFSGLHLQRNSSKEISLVEGGGTVVLASNQDVELFPTYQRGSFMIGDMNGLNLGMDGNEIMARNSNGISTLFLQADGGDLSIGNMAGSHTEINGTEIMAKSGTNSATLFMQPLGGNVQMGSALMGTTDVIIHSLSGSGTADLQVDANGKLMRSSSDVRLKKNILPIENALEHITQLRGVSYQWKDRPGQDLTFGLIAQEVQEIIPEIVTHDGTYLGINYSELPALIIEAIKEQQSIIETQAKTIEVLLKRMGEMEKRLSN